MKSEVFIAIISLKSSCPRCSCSESSAIIESGLSDINGYFPEYPVDDKFNYECVDDASDVSWRSSYDSLIILTLTS